ncbi:MAG: hypothetical protein COZ16_06340 [Flavobacteriaceae bacterium CG_4_10_14_3_um_filter_31_253]|nr:MAG: hypothetical protein AUK46_11520 [Flavobacteriaceae bacterium CG2_30_31_66]PIV97636.1 MAG: hypothetical protein COW43_01970 [Flavobacteriaceae bacterium CG17_big_fil_post_rev_8_21_14_2_50_31_13]PIX11548.1 MAG: hypothetical protein COZ74_13815 [Flavobacteriaceae bacterium CG_4_8_14_3_um_filter_31_8]PIY14903.1 MAG: hypothetical protein COZ16_06340 [Flavobacteriaceae bacterium CG_4_10_14_3_um_filter_31_253]PIZ11743.1 MAG: hypothetical protein COY55_03335 [Flavobacteriaceae bacterium CG_4_1
MKLENNNIMRNLTKKELLVINGGGPIWKWFGKLYGYLENYTDSQRDNVMKEIQNGNVLNIAD